MIQKIISEGIWSFTMENKQEPTYCIIHPHDWERMYESMLRNMTLCPIDLNGKMTYRGVKLLRSFDIEEGSPIFVIDRLFFQSSFNKKGAINLPPKPKSNG